MSDSVDEKKLTSETSCRRERVNLHFTLNCYRIELAPTLIRIISSTVVCVFENITSEPFSLRLYNHHSVR